MLGEFDLIRAILSDNCKHRDLVIPNGDDAAVLRCGGQLVAVSVDTIIEGSHFSLDYFTPRQIGIKGLESSLSDIVAVGGRPEFALVSITVSKRGDFAKAEDIYAGIRDASARCGVIVIGGDTTVGGDSLSLSVTSIGRIPSDEWITPRSGARVGNQIYVTGALGGSAAGLHLFTAKIAGFERLKLKHLEPKCRVDLANSIGLIATSMIDISDGLSSELYHICEASKVGCVVYEDRLPIDLDTRELAAKSHLDPFRWAWNGGEDYELLFTCEPKDAAVAPGTLIGEVTEERVVLVERGGTREKVVRGGYDHFRRGEIRLK
jgi:thiamine-monophosphate kinase